MTNTESPPPFRRDDLKFIADTMLGRLARWIRIIGYDVEYHRVISDDELIRKAIAGNRILLTRDVKLINRKAVRHCLYIGSEDYLEQLKQVVEHYSLSVQSKLFLRCVICNSQLHYIEKKDVEDRVPLFVYQTQNTFMECPGCMKIYWSGTHRKQIMERLSKILPMNP